jgi:hypothetical protein
MQPLPISPTELRHSPHQLPLGRPALFTNSQPLQKKLFGHSSGSFSSVATTARDIGDEKDNCPEPIIEDD